MMEEAKGQQSLALRRVGLGKGGAFFWMDSKSFYHLCKFSGITGGQ